MQGSRPSEPEIYILFARKPNKFVVNAIDQCGAKRLPFGRSLVSRAVAKSNCRTAATRSREDVDRCATLLKEMAATIIRGPVEGSWAPGYYYVLFEDPDGIRLEACFVPGAGLLASGASFNPSEGYI